MNNTGKYKRGITEAFVFLMLLAALFVTDIPVKADTTDAGTTTSTSTSINAVTVKAEIKASSNTALKISWQKTPLAKGYVIYRRESTKKAYRRIAKVSASRSTYLNKYLTSSKPYQYAVRAYRKENGKTVYSRFTPVTGATRPATVKTTIKASSSTAMKVTWKKSSRADGYRIYRKPSGGKWSFVADVAKNLTSYSDTKVSANTKYVYTVRPYKKGGKVKYMAAIRLSNQAATPKAAVVKPGNSTVVSNSKFTDAQKDVMKKILYAVETGGQVYGKQDYGDFTEAYTNSSTEYAITIGAGQWYGTEAQRLLKLIHETMGEAEWNKIDTGNHYVWKAVCNENWSKYKIPKSSWRARVIIKLLQTDTGIKCQDQLMYQQIAEYETEVRNLGITDVQAVGMFINIRHQGGYGAVTRVLKKTAKPYNLINVYKALASDSGGQVGTYKTRQAKVYQWLLTYMK